MWFAIAAIAISLFSGLEASKQKKKGREAEARAIQAQRESEAIDVLEGIDDLAGQQTAQYLKSGVEAHVGSPFMVIASSARRAIKDAEDIRKYGQTEAAYIRERAGYEEKAGQIGAVGGAISSGLGVASRSGTAGEGASFSSENEVPSYYLGGFSLREEV